MKKNEIRKGLFEIKILMSLKFKKEVFQVCWFYIGMYG